MKTQTSIHFLMSKFLISFTNVVSKGHFHNLCFRFIVKTGIKENSYFFCSSPKFINFFIANINNKKFLVEKTQIMTPDYWKQMFDI